MIDHLSIQCADLNRSATFYDTLLDTVGSRRVIEHDRRIGYGTDFPHFWIGPLDTGPAQREIHVAFTCTSREQVDEFHRTAIELGSEILHAPKLWPEYHSGYYGVFVRDPDGNNVEAVHHSFV